MDGKFQEIYRAENSDNDQGKTTVAAADYRIDASIKNDRETNDSCCAQPMRWNSSPHAYLLGILAAFAIVGIYLGMNTLTSNWYFARVQSVSYTHLTLPTTPYV